MTDRIDHYGRMTDEELTAYVKQRNEAAYERITAGMSRKPGTTFETVDTPRGSGYHPHRWGRRA